MFCSECGVEATGRFCWSCGKPLHEPSSDSSISGNIKALPAIDWSELTDCRALVAVPEVRARIARHAALAKTKFSGEDFLECCDQLMGTLTGGVPLTLIAKIAQPISEKLGFKTGKNRRESLTERPGVVIVAVLCSLAQNDQKLHEIEPATVGCTIRAAVPSDVWSLKGDLLISIRAENDITLVEAGITIPGQVYDWGKSNRVLDRLFGDLGKLAKAA
jgi:hypothetical protein